MLKILGPCSSGHIPVSWQEGASESWAWGQLDCEQPPRRTVRQLTGHCSERPTHQVCVSEVSDRKEADLHNLGLTWLQLGCVTLGKSPSPQDLWFSRLYDGADTADLRGSSEG